MLEPVRVCGRTERGASKSRMWLGKLELKWKRTSWANQRQAHRSVERGAPAGEKCQNLNRGRSWYLLTEKSPSSG